MEKSLESLEPPAASESMEELPSPAKVLLPSSSQGGRIGEVWDEYDKGTIAIWLIDMRGLCMCVCVCEYD